MRKRILVAGAAVAALAGCSASDVHRAQMFLPGAASGIATSSVALDDLTMARLADSDVPLILASRDGKVTGTFTQDAGDGTAEVWVSPEGTQMSMQNGILVAADLSGDALIRVEPASPVTALAGASYVRAYHHTDGDGARVTSYDCTMSAPRSETLSILDVRVPAATLTESCTGPSGATIENAYAVAADGTVVRSRQWVSADLGYVELDRLIR